MTDFKKLSLSDKVLARLDEIGHTTPTAIQEKAIPLILQGRDVLGCAQTGTGKTAAYVLPILDILSQGRSKAMMPRTLILVPTRELAIQVEESFKDYGKTFKLKSVLIMGGVSSLKQEQSLAKGVDVVMATPGRFLDLYDRGKILLADLKMLVVDEADRMLDMGFIPDIQRIVSLLPRSRHTILLSATMPKEIKSLATKLLDNPKEVTVSPPTQTGENIEQKLIFVPRKSKDSDYDKREALRQLLAEQSIKSAIVFCNRKKDVDTLQRSLVRHGFQARGLHGDLAQKTRTETLEMFKAGELPFLIASDIAARGLDVDDLPNVINYSVPHNGEDYIHRIGRTGRAGKQGHAWTLVAARDQKNMTAIEKTIKVTIDYLPGFAPKDTGSASSSAKPSNTKPPQAKSPSAKASKSQPSKAQPADEKKSNPKPAAERKAAPRSAPAAAVKGFGDDLPAFLR